MIRTKIKTPIQQLDQVSESSFVSRRIMVHVRDRMLTLVLPDHKVDLLHTRLQLSTNPFCDIVHVVQHVCLLFQLSAHGVCLHA